MDLIHAVILGLVQGITEFVPVSSSGHLVLAHHFLGIKETGLQFDVALHAGTLLALLVYFRRDLWKLLKAVLSRRPQARLVWLLAIATGPAAVAGYLLESRAETSFRSPVLVSVNLLIIGLVMLAAEAYYHRKVNRPTQLDDTSWQQALAMGVAQAVSVIPGVSRSGSTITTGLFAGMDRVAATRFSFLLGIPIMIGALLKVMLEPASQTALRHGQSMFVVGIVTAFVSGWLAIRFLLNFLGHHGLTAFAYYRIGLAVVVLAVAVLGR